MLRSGLWSLLVLLGFVASGPLSVLAQQAPATAAPEQDIVESDPAAATAREQQLLSAARQLTFEGRRAGEGYFSADGTKLVFQSERDSANPFFQIYLMDLETGDVEQISPGYGKTTCAWISPDGEHILYASTQDDPDARAKQKEELELRASGQERRYSWDYDPHYDIYEYDLDTGKYTNLTNTPGYDAEGSYSPDGSLIAFASNREAYTGEMTAEEKEKFEIDPAIMNDLYVMNADGTDVRRITSTLGYDGGPFFSPDGNRLCWRRFSENGATAEIMTANIEGSNVKQLTHMEAMSWAPFYHPSGEYLIFTTNKHGFANFELYLIDVEGQSEPVRVTYTAGFDGLPVFSPDGTQLAWTTNRTPSGQSQLFLGRWNHEKALELLGIDEADSSEDADSTLARSAADDAAAATRPSFAPADIVRHVEFLCRPELGGRLTGTPGEKLATEYVASYFETLGLEPAGDDGTYFQEFDFTSGVAIGENNRLAWGERQYEVSEDWVPLAFSETGSFDPASLVFAGYGISAPESDAKEDYDSYVHLDVTDKWVLAFRYMPEGISAERRQRLARYSSLRFKAMLARDNGARGLIVVSGPTSGVRNELVRLAYDGSLAGSSIPVVSVTDDVAAEWLATAGKDLEALQKSLDTGEPQMGFALPEVELAAEIDIEKVRETGRNVLAMLPAGSPHAQTVIVGAHIDHLGKGGGGSSLARENERGQIHVGADDNASGVAAMLEIAEYLADQKKSDKLEQQKNVLFAAWSGEELGLIGSSRFAEDLADQLEPLGFSQDGSLYPFVAACLNLDMVGRMDDALVLQGVGSSPLWRTEIERRNVPVGLPITLQDDSYLPTDASTFFMRGVPILSAFTGSHSDYHTPRDTPEKLNYEAAASIARLMGLIARSLATSEEAPEYVAQQKPEESERRASLRAYLGTIPDYAKGDIRGVSLSGVAKNGPADKAGVQGGDIIIELAGKKIENIYDYTYAIEALKIGDEVEIRIRRDGEERTLTITPGSRE